MSGGRRASSVISIDDAIAEIVVNFASVTFQILMLFSSGSHYHLSTLSVLGDGLGTFQYLK